MFSSSFLGLMMVCFRPACTHLNYYTGYLISLCLPKLRQLGRNHVVFFASGDLNLRPCGSPSTLLTTKAPDHWVQVCCPLLVTRILNFPFLLSVWSLTVLSSIPLQMLIFFTSDWIITYLTILTLIPSGDAHFVFIAYCFSFWPII